MSGLKLIHELKMMFTTIVIGMRSYVEPTPVLATIIDDGGQ